MQSIIQKKNLFLYIVIEVLLFIGVKILELIQAYDFRMCVVKYACIVVDFIVAFCIFSKWRKGKKKIWDDLIFLGIFLIFLADLVLTLLALVISNKLWGFAIFCMVQIVFCIYMKPGKINILIRALVLAIAWFVLIKINLMSIPNATGIFNITLIAVNMVCSWVMFNKDRTKKNLYFAIGLTLFAICDINLLIRTVSLEHTLINEIARFTVWTAYIPAIVMLTLTYAQAVADYNKAEK